MVSVEQVMKEGLSLPSVWRAWLAEKLVESLEFNVDEKLQTLWVSEAKKRRDEIRSGIVQPIVPSGATGLLDLRRWEKFISGFAYKAKLSIQPKQME